ncbi:MAG: indolepyruvate oxidoreductase subunit beta family protein [Pseudomonadota bacterium]
MAESRPYKIAINALGGQGGGVLANWIIALGEATGFLVQSTSVPGVAQRTGATVYYLELFPQALAKQAGQAPVLALMPLPGDVDIVLASEIIEAGRAVDRGFVTEKTTLIASSHRVYAIGEKIGMGDGRVDPAAIFETAEKAAGRFLVADLERCVEQTGSIISSVIFGALAGSEALPIPRDAFEAVIRQSGRAVEINLAGFAAGFEAIRGEAAPAPDLPSEREFSAAPAVKYLVNRLEQQVPAAAQSIAYEGLKKVVDHSGPAYGETYLKRLTSIVSLDQDRLGAARLSDTAARHLALWMAFEDTIRVADLKTRSSRFARFRHDVRAAPDQIVHVSEYMHPRVEEMCDLLPPPLARLVLKTRWVHRALSLVLSKGRRMPTTRLRGFLPLYALAGLKPLRRFTYKYQIENARIEDWLDTVRSTVAEDYDLAVQVARLQRLIKGYGDTHARGLNNFNRIMAALPQIRQQPAPAETLERIHGAALGDEGGQMLDQALAALTEQRAA